MERFKKDRSKNRRIMNIVLIGMRGAGKTTVAKLLSTKLQKEVLETDDLVSRKAGMSITEIVATKGWYYFRDLESEVISDVSKTDNIIISCGGGVVVRPKNIDLLKQNGKIFWLQVSVTTLLTRIGHDQNRPSITGKPQKEDMEETLKNRYDLYKNAADFIIGTEKKTPKQIVDTISQLQFQYGIGIASRNGTKLCCIIGDPVEHSLSPAMHNAAYKALGLNFAYLAFRVTDVKNAIAGIRALGIKGVSVTAPHKISVMQYLDTIDETAKKIGAVNTIVNTNGKLTGYNTDSQGAIMALKEKTTLPGKRVVILGAGGAARAITFGLDKKDTSVFTVNRTTQKEKVLAEIKNSDILINATPIGMHPRAEESLIPKEYLHKNLTVFDVVYNPKETKLLKDARSAGCTTIYGYKMLLYQAVSQFQLFTGEIAPVSIMEKELLKNL